jgi:hypothetical protein
MKRSLSAFTLLLGLAAPLAAQAGNPCTYDTCALRMRGAGFFKPAYLVRGEGQQEVLMLAPFGAPTAPLFQGSDSAFVAALEYDRLQPVASVLNLAGPALLVLGPFLTNWREKPFASFAIMAGGFGMSIYGTYLMNAANDELSRAIWYHNRELVRRE